MKKINYLLGSLFLAGPLVFTSCEKEEDEKEITEQVSDTVDEVKKYSLTIITSENGEVEVNSDALEFGKGTEVTLTAIANEGYEFTQWSNGSTANPLTITITENTTLEASFSELYIVKSDNGVT